MLFDISGAPEFLRALTRVLEEWEVMTEGGGSRVVSCCSTSMIGT